MSLITHKEPRICEQFSNYIQEPSYRLALSVLDVLGDNLTSLASLDELDKYHILHEEGTARNLHKINIKNSLYEDPSLSQDDTMGELW